ncbi:hypothetical protein HUJ05_004110 [Dendroctonus ponderosae]|nr:hypothetical protein HUJ05_004110 [Dendroctonus ponderosae]
MWFGTPLRFKDNSQLEMPKDDAFFSSKRSVRPKMRIMRTDCYKQPRPDEEQHFGAFFRRQRQFVTLG